MSKPIPSPSAAPLAGIKVLDFTRLVPGPVCTLHLADLGADVVKVEDTGAGDHAPPALRAILNRNKRGLRLDLKQPEGVQALLALARRADVLVEGFRPGVMERLGVGYDAMAQVNPRIVYCSLTGYGQTGPYRDRPGHDLNYCADAGVAHQLGSDAGTPALSNLPIADLMGGALTAAMGILAALFDAARSGRGRHVDIAMADGALAHAVMPFATLSTRGAVCPPGGDTLTGGLACYAVYRTADARFVALGALERKFWDATCDLLGRPDLKPLHRTGDASVEQRLRAELGAIFASRPLAHWESLDGAAAACLTPVRTLDEAVADPHYAARRMVHESVHPAYGRVVQPGCPVKLSGFEFSLRRPAPLPGQHSAEVLAEAGIDPETIERWLGKRVVSSS